MSTHTPGPWTYDADSWEVRAPSRFRKAEIAIVEVGWNEPFESEQLANARLIAVSPELLKALQDLVANQDAANAAAGFKPEQRLAMPYLKTARAAIAKATMGQP